MNKRILLSLVSTIVFLVTTEISIGQEWTRFRGPNGTGVASKDITIPAKWNPENIKWKIPVPGRSHSSPVLWGSKLFLSTVQGSSQVLICIDSKTGKPLWDKKFDGSTYRIHKFNSYASTSAAVSADSVFFTWGTPQSTHLVALDHDGNIKWEKNLGSFQSQHGFANSPMIEGNKVIIANDQLGVSYLAAFDVSSGDQIWRVERKSGTKTAYSTPCLFEPQKGKPYLIFNSSSHGITGVDPETGGVLWEKGGLFDKRSVSSPVFSKNLIFGSCGSGGGGNYVVAISAPNDTTQIHPPKLEHKFRRSAPYVPTPLVVNERIYFWSDQGIVSCINLEDGETLFSERTNQRFFGSPVLVGENLFCISTTGVVTVVKAGKSFELVATNDLKEESNSTPAVANGRMYVRTVGHLFCIGE